MASLGIVDEASPGAALFTYGSLQLPSVQLDTFGRLLDGGDDVLCCFTIDHLAVDEEHREAARGRTTRSVLRHTGSRLDKVVGKLVRLSEAELDAADEYEAWGYRRERVTLESGARGWVYVGDR